MSKKRTVRFRYKGPLAVPLRPNESMDAKLLVLLKDLGASDRSEGYVKLALRHVPGVRRGTKFVGNRLLDPVTESLFLEAVWGLIQDAGKLSLKKAVRTIYDGLENNSPIREHTVDTMYAYCKEWRSRDRAYEKAHDEKLAPMRRKYEKLARALMGTADEVQQRSFRIARELGPPTDVVRPPLRAKRGRR